MTYDSSRMLSQFDFAKKRNFLRHFFDFDTERFERMLREEGEQFWNECGRKRSLRIFHAAAERVPAYADFLRRHKLSHTKIKSFEDFSQVPLTDKENYIQKYPLAMRTWDGELSEEIIIAASSGTSGEPTAWPRAAYQEFEAAVFHELIYRYSFDIEKYASLVIIGFPMGIYVSGVATLIPSFLVGAKHRHLTIASVGNNKIEALRAIKNLQKDFEQIILVGHPLFVKDIIESGAQEGISWGKRRVRMMFCSEEFSEEWRKYVMDEAGISSGIKTSISTYGSSEFLLMAWETPLSITLRTIMERDLEIRKELVDVAAVPNIFQYNPFFRFIESIEHDLVFTSASGIPLVRFNLHDVGQILSFEKVMGTLTKTGDAPVKEFSKLNEKLLWRLPFVTLGGRSNYKIIFYAANIYPEHIRPALSQAELFPKLTGKFTLRKGYLKNMDEYLELNVELRNNIKPSAHLAAKIKEYMIARLKKVNMEYLFVCNNNPGKDLDPKIKLWPYQHEKYFKPGLKPRYIAES